MMVGPSFSGFGVAVPSRGVVLDPPSCGCVWPVLLVVGVGLSFSGWELALPSC